MLEKIKRIKKTAKTKLQKSKDDHRYIVGLDIGTEYVKALVAQVSGSHAKIIGVGRAHQGLGDMQAGAIADISAVVANCDKALSEAEQQAGLSARTAVLGIAGELVKGRTTNVRIRRKSPDKAIDIAEFERIIGVVQARSEEKARAALAWELGGKELDIRLVNSALVGIDIDGYKVTNPIGFQGRDIIISLYTAFAPLIHIGALEKTAEELDLDLLAVAAEPFAVSRSVIGDDSGSSMSAILMDVGGGTTDIAVVNDGGVQGTKMFGIGGRAFTRSIEKDMGIDFSEAEDLKLQLKDGSLPKDKKEHVVQALQKTLDVWTHGVELALGEFTSVDNLPNRLLLCGGGSSLEMLPNQLENSTWYRELPFTKKPNIKLIQPNQVVGITDETGLVKDHTLITAMGLVRVGIDTLTQGEQTGGSFKQKIDKMLRV